LQPNLVPSCAHASYQISGQSNNAFAFHDNFFCLTKEEKQQRKQEKKTLKQLSQFLKVYILEMPGAKFGMTLANISTAKIIWFH